PHVYPGTVAGNIRRLGCPDPRELETLPAATAQLRRPYVRSAPGHLVAMRDSGSGLELDGVRAMCDGAGTRAPSCALEVWVPGAAPPEVVESTGIEQLEPRRLDPGPARLGPSGGWLLRGCVTAARYHLRVQS